MGRVISQGYILKFDDGKTGWVDSLTLTNDEGAHKKELAEKAECERRGGVAVGMTRAQVYASCWGRPQRINTTTTAGGDHGAQRNPGLSSSGDRTRISASFHPAYSLCDMI
jgi:hypothetical protein